MTAITGGSITYSRTTQPAQYESKKAEVTLAFGIEEGTSGEVMRGFINAVCQQAMGQANHMLLVGDKVDPKAGAAEVPPLPVAEPVKPRTRGKGKEQTENPFGGEKPPEPVSEVIPPASTGGFGEQTGGDGQDTPDGAGQTAMRDASPSNDFVVGDLPSIEISDVEVTDACNKTASRLGSPEKMLNVLRTYVTTGQTQRHILQEKRQEFIDKLNALT